jgi:NADP-dependent 3-hydroxy acid dehydrogenase YdfG
MKIFITGVSSGIGRALAIELISQGHSVWGVARRRPVLKKLHTSMQKHNKNFILSVCDVSSQASVNQVFAQMKKRKFLPDVIVLNAAINQQDVNKSLHLDAFKQNFETNLNGALIWVEAFLPAFRRRQKGTFIAISSMAAYRPGYMSTGYSASKAALSNAFRGLSINFSTKDLKFITIHFGPINTDLWPGPTWPGMSTAQQAAGFIIRSFSKKSGNYYFPFIITRLTWLSAKLPNNVLAYGYKKYKKRFNSVSKS